MVDRERHQPLRGATLHRKQGERAGYALTCPISAIAGVTSHVVSVLESVKEAALAGRWLDELWSVSIVNVSVGHMDY